MSDTYVCVLVKHININYKYNSYKTLVYITIYYYNSTYTIVYKIEVKFIVFVSPLLIGWPKIVR
jgi:hypothetical protein